MKVIFLDADGVLNSDEYFDKIQNLNIHGIESEIKLLKRVIDETGAEVVLCSSWRYTKNGECLKKLLTQYEIYPDSTPIIDNKRGLEIKKWILDNPDIEDFVILDDEIFPSYDDFLLEKLIKISDKNGHSFGEGLQEKDVDEIITKFGRLKKSVSVKKKVLK